jgi:hypothetical protein
MLQQQLLQKELPNQARWSKIEEIKGPEKLECKNK